MTVIDNILAFIIILGLLKSGMEVIFSVLVPIVKFIIKHIPEPKDDPELEMNFSLKDHDFSGNSYCGEFRTHL